MPTWVYGYQVKFKHIRALTQRLNVYKPGCYMEMFTFTLSYVRRKARAPSIRALSSARGYQIYTFVQNNDRKLDDLRLTQEQMDSVKDTLGFTSAPQWYNLNAYPDPNSSGDDEPALRVSRGPLVFSGEWLVEDSEDEEDDNEDEDEEENDEQWVLEGYRLHPKPVTQ